MTKKKRLGKGLGALLSNIDDSIEENKQEVVTQLSSSIAEVPLVQIEVNPFQPRVDFDQAALEDLSASIQTHGLIQPITLRRLNENRYQLISGERRLRASKLAGLDKVPAYIRVANDQEMLEMALVENIQRENLNAIEIAITYKRLLDECDLTHDNLSTRIGKNRSTVTNYLRLLKLPPNIQLGVKDSSISMGHARCLVGVDDIALQLTLFSETLDKSLSVRDLEGLIRKYNVDKKQKPRKPRLAAEYQKVQDELSSYLAAKVQLKRKDDGKGSLQIHFSNDDDLNRLLDLIEKQ